MEATAPAPYRTPRPVRRALLVVGAVVALLLVAEGTMHLLQVATRHTTTEVATYRGITALEIDDDSDIRLTSAPAGTPLEVRARVTESLIKPDWRAQRRDGSTLHLSSSCSPAIFADICGVDYDIRVPSGTAIRADTSAGDVVAENLRSTMPVRLDTSAGDITVIGATAPELRLSASAGDIRAGGVRADRVQVETSAGDVRVSLLGLADELSATSSAGDVELVVPDALYRVETDTSAGSIDDQEVRTSPDATRTIRAVTSAGDIRIEARR